MHPEKNIAKLNNFILNEVILKEKGSVRHKTQQKHFLTLVRKITSISNGEAKIHVKDSFNKFKISISPKEGLYKNGTFLFTFSIPNKYPHVSPYINCDTLIYHPNIDEDGAVCLNILEEWDSNVHDLTDCVQGLLYLFYNPNLEDPLSMFMSAEISEEEFERNVKICLEGGIIDGVIFPINNGSTTLEL